MITGIVTDIIAIYTIVLVILFIGLTLIALSSMNEESMKHELLVENSERKTPEPIGISVIIGGTVSEDDLEWLLSIDYFNYEVVVVTDLSKLSCSEEVMQKYSMIEVTHPTHLELPGVCIRKLYRSRERRYRKLVIADHSFTTLCDAYNVGVCISSLDYVIAVNRWTRLNADSLRRLSTEIQDHPEDIYAIGALRSPVISKSSLCVVDHIVKLLTSGIGTGVLSGIGTYPDTAIMFEYNAVVDAGGYKDNFSSDLELHTRVKSLADRKLLDGISIFTPQIISHHTESDSSCCSRTPNFAKRHKSPLVSPYAITTALILITVLLPISVISSDWEQTRLLLYICATAYAGSVSVGLLAILSYRKTLKPHGYDKSISQLIGATFAYPFMLLICLIKAKNFLKS